MVSLKSTSVLKHRLSSKLHSLTRPYKQKDITSASKPPHRDMRATTKLRLQKSRVFFSLRSISGREHFETQALPHRWANTGTRVSKLNFGPFIYDDVEPSAHSPPHDISTLRNPKRSQEPFTPNSTPLGLGHPVDLSGDAARGYPENEAPLCVDSESITSAREDAFDVTSTEHSVYAAASWADPLVATSRDTSTYGLFASNSLLQGLGASVSRKEDWSLDTEAMQSTNDCWNQEGYV